MAQQFLYITDPLSSLNANSDTTLAIMQEAQKRDIKNFGCELKNMVLRADGIWFHAAPLKLKLGYTRPPAYLAPQVLMPIEEFEIVFMRKDPPMDENFLAALFMLTMSTKSKSLVLNSPQGILRANEKLFGYEIAKQFYPTTMVASDKETLNQFAREQKNVVLKPLFQAGGSQILVFEYGDRNWLSALETLTCFFTKPVMAQSYITDARKGDKRVIVLGGKAVGALLRVPAEYDHRANCHVGGKPKPAQVNERDLEIVDALRPHLLSHGLHFVGIDIIAGYLTEINVTSPTCIIEIERLSQKPHERSIRSQILDYVEGLIAQ